MRGDQRATGMRRDDIRVGASLFWHLRSRFGRRRRAFQVVEPACVLGARPRSRHRSCSHSATRLRVFQREDDVPYEKQADGVLLRGWVDESGAVYSFPKAPPLRNCSRQFLSGECEKTAARSTSPLPTVETSLPYY